MTTTFLSRKHDRAFGHLDQNANGVIERDDLVGLGVRILSGFGESPTSAKGKALVGSFLDIWEALLAQADTDNDGKLTPAEYHAAMTGAFIANDGGYERAFRPAVQSVLELGDTDGDGTLSRAEFETIQLAFGTPGDQIEAAFRSLDRDSSGTLTVDELLAAARQFYTADDEQAPGNWLFGEL